MGKRSDFKRIERDYYRSLDPRIGRAIRPHIRPGTRYVEPGAGAGDLILQLQGHATCVRAVDLEPQAGWVGDGEDRVWIERGDFFDLSIGDAEMWIGNPPWRRDILHRLIVHLSDQAPALLIFDSAWQHTLQAAPFMVRCRKIITIGRVIWIPDTKMSGKDDVSAYLFDRPLAGSTPDFYGRGCLPTDAARRTRRICPDCNVLIDRFGRWKLQTRQGVPTPVHVDCKHPSGSRALAPTPLFDILEEGEGSNDREAQAPERGA